MKRAELPAPVLREHEGILVVRDDLLSGGTKRRALHVLMDEEHEEFVYPAPAYGHAQIALAYTCRDYGKRATVFCAKRKERFKLTREAAALGAQIIEVPNGYLAVVTARAREYCEQTGAKLLPFGLDHPDMIKALADVARSLDINPHEVWSITSSGVLSRSLQLAWPHAKFFGIRVGAAPKSGRATVYTAPEAFDKDAKYPPPFPSCKNYDAKIWQFVKRHASPGALLWNVAG